MVFNIPKTKEKKMELKEELINYKLLLAERRIRAEENKKERLGLNHKNNEEIIGILSIRRQALEEIYGTLHG